MKKKNYIEILKNKKIIIITIIVYLISNAFLIFGFSSIDNIPIKEFLKNSQHLQTYSISAAIYIIPFYFVLKNNFKTKQKKFFEEKKNYITLLLVYYVVYMTSIVAIPVSIILKFLIINNLIAGITSIALLTIILIAGVILINKTLVNDFKNLKNFKNNLSHTICIYISALLFSSILQHIVNRYVIVTNANEAAVNVLENNMGFWLSFILIVILAPLVEEFIYRVAIFGLFDEKKQKQAIIASAFIFGIIHVSQGMVENFLNIFNIIPYITIGFALGYIYYKTKNIYYPIIVHVLNNLIGIIL